MTGLKWTQRHLELHNNFAEFYNEVICRMCGWEISARLYESLQIKVIQQRIVVKCKTFWKFCFKIKQTVINNIKLYRLNKIVPKVAPYFEV